MSDPTLTSAERQALLSAAGPQTPMTTVNLAATVERIKAEAVHQAWPCANYAAPVTCISAPSSATGRCLFCYTMTREAVERERAETKDRIARAIERQRNTHWQQHLSDHPFADARSCPADYAAHDAYLAAFKIALAEGSNP